MTNINDHEYRIHSQNGEDGIISLLASGLKAKSARRFIEVGTSDGGENNSMYLLKRGWGGLGIEADAAKVRRYVVRLRERPDLAGRATLAAMKVCWDNCLWIMERGGREPEFFSLDIDSVDYYIAHRLMHAGFSPAIVCCEYNAFLGPKPLTVGYNPQFSRYGFDPERGLYFGASAAAWRHLFGGFGYRCVGVDSAGVNVFFCRPGAFEPGFLEGLHGPQHLYAAGYMQKNAMSGEALQQELLARPLPFIDVSRVDVAQIAQDTVRPPPDTPLVHKLAPAVLEGIAPARP